MYLRGSDCQKLEPPPQYYLTIKPNPNNQGNHMLQCSSPLGLLFFFVSALSLSPRSFCFVLGLDIIYITNLLPVFYIPDDRELS